MTKLYFKPKSTSFEDEEKHLLIFDKETKEIYKSQNLRKPQDFKIKAPHIQFKFGDSTQI